MFDYEGELAFIVGCGGRHISREDAWSHVAGYTCFAENSVRDWQRHSQQVTAGKNFDRSGACGPWMVTADAMPDVRSLALTTRLNGVAVQHDTTAILVFDIPTILDYVSAFTTLSPGDVIVRGRPMASVRRVSRRCG